MTRLVLKREKIQDFLEKELELSLKHFCIKYLFYPDF